ncbi:MAG TPA: hypothetical protein VGO04_24720 [Ensifer sp.]|uniref:hypothetical protein n=1 Tax=Ensifer sp. TaxID=1872086 RepID=UPI002E12AED6|nr:hypothetical protein [Ensifer sp.]
MENGFKIMSQHADEGRSELKQDSQNSVSAQLKTYGVDTDQRTETAPDRASELQQLLIDEIRARPMRALGWAAAAGAAFGFWAAR